VAVSINKTLVECCQGQNIFLLCTQTAWPNVEKPVVKTCIIFFINLERLTNFKFAQKSTFLKVSARKILARHFDCFFKKGIANFLIRDLIVSNINGGAGMLSKIRRQKSFEGSFSNEGKTSVAREKIF